MSAPRSCCTHRAVGLRRQAPVLIDNPSDVRQVQHVVTTLQAVRDGLGSWRGGADGHSLSARASYTDGEYEAVRRRYNRAAKVGKL